MSNQLLNCARCGKPVSQGAFKCPHCGEQKFKYIPCHHCNTPTKGFEIIDYKNDSYSADYGEVYVAREGKSLLVSLSKTGKSYPYCPDCYNNIIKIGRIPVIPQISIKCPTCNHLLNHQPILTKKSLSYRYYSNRKEYVTLPLPCPNCGQPNIQSFFEHPYVQCFWCDGVLNYNNINDRVEAYGSPYVSYERQVKVHLHKNCATPKNLKTLGVRLYSPSELFWAKFRWFADYIADSIFGTVCLMSFFLVIHFILKSVMKIDIFPVFVIAPIAIVVYVVYYNFSKDFKKNKNATGKD